MKIVGGGVWEIMALLCWYFIHSMQKPWLNLKLEAQVSLSAQGSSTKRTMVRLKAAETRRHEDETW